ncbi:MAG TPA: TIGR03557 family F420-dependent LLM class oxidoreductase [Actinomycetota bacterium]|nr:TIGR03557 family F420-dependent LLM class oxidoreductase [Actinomycetota bacterium]
MVEFGYKLSSEEHGPRALVRLAARAEQAGFAFASISDHFHPWIDDQGHAPFVWSVLGGVSEATENLRVLTGVTCPTIRTHPAIVAHAAATAAVMLPGRFALGVGSGENLNEHILGDRWPEVDVRLEMLEEAVEVMRALWDGGLTSHHGRHYTVENARLYDLPEERPPVLVAAGGSKAVELAGRIGDGLVSLAPAEGLLERFDEAGGRGKPRYAEVNVCWATDEDEARRTAHRLWPIAGMKGQLSQELPVPSHFSQAAETVRVEDVVETVACGPDPEAHIENAKKFLDAGYDHIWFHQIGPDQEGFFGFYEREVLPRLR